MKHCCRTVLFSYPAVFSALLICAAHALETAFVEVVIYEQTGGDYTTYTYKLKGQFSDAGAATSAEGDIVEVRSSERGLVSFLFCAQIVPSPFAVRAQASHPCLRSSIRTAARSGHFLRNAHLAIASSVCSNCLQTPHSKRQVRVLSSVYIRMHAVGSF